MSVLIDYFDCDNANESIWDALRKCFVTNEAGEVGLRIFTDIEPCDICLTEITDATIITMITNEANWDDAIPANYSGAYTGMVAYSFYIDYANSLKYFYNGTYLIRSTFNDFEI